MTRLPGVRQAIGVIAVNELRMFAEDIIDVQKGNAKFYREGNVLERQTAVIGRAESALARRVEELDDGHT